MYEVDDLDRVIEMRDVPASSVGAPLPVVLADEHSVLLAYLASAPESDWDETSLRVVGPESEEPAVIVEFSGAIAHMFGPPNDEAFDGHPLALRGLRPYGAYRIDNSSWVRRLERMNRVHRHHDAERFFDRSHFIFAFHDSTFECIATSLRADAHPGPLRNTIAAMQKRLLGQP